MAALAVWSAWARAGTRPALQGPFAVLGCLILLAAIGTALTARRADPRPDDAGAGHPARWRLALVALAGMAFLGLLLVQWWNAGRHPYFHPFESRWVFTPPPYPGWPSAVDRAEAAEMLRWFFPAWAIMIALLCCRLRAGWWRTLAACLVVNASALSLFGIIQLLSGTARMYWRLDINAYFFASFGYANHAAAYFILHAGLAGSLLVRAVGRAATKTGGRKPVLPGRRTIVLPALATTLCLAGAMLSLSRAGIGFAVALMLLIAWQVVCATSARMRLPGRVTVGVVAGLCLVLIALNVATLGGAPLRRESAALVRADWPATLQTRLFMVKAAATIWQDAPWFGVGGWGYRHFLPVYGLEKGISMRSGYANVHNDAMQFLCEFGVVGIGLLTTALVAFCWPLITGGPRLVQAGLLPALGGLAAVLLHSLLDLPFRSPAILFAWVVIAGLVEKSRLASRDLEAGGG